jgi:inositol phosphorylceramide synthase catalytic subunit
LHAVGNPAGFKHFDQIVGWKIFSSMYSKNANVFAAMPSLHAAYPLLTVLYGSSSKSICVQSVFVLFTISVWFSAVYSRHHYVFDVLAGGLCALCAYVVYRFLARQPTIDRYLDIYSRSI